MPSITVVPSENTEETSQSMCAVVKGYPMVIRNSDDPGKHWNIPFDAPLFHWYTDADRDRQLSAYMKETFGVSEALTKQAIGFAAAAQDAFHEELRKDGKEVCEQVQAAGTYAVVLASRPYQNDDLVNHGLADDERDFRQDPADPEAG
jgi:predicted nucleotide-binding protein (sugar kinase/HSP70/actin superfamily)